MPKQPQRLAEISADLILHQTVAVFGFVAWLPSFILLALRPRKEQGPGMWGFYPDKNLKVRFEVKIKVRAIETFA